MHKSTEFGKTLLLFLPQFLVSVCRFRKQNPTRIKHNLLGLDEHEWHFDSAFFLSFARMKFINRVACSVWVIYLTQINSRLCWAENSILVKTWRPQNCQMDCINRLNHFSGTRAHFCQLSLIESYSMELILWWREKRIKRIDSVLDHGVPQPEKRPYLTLTSTLYQQD